MKNKYLNFLFKNIHSQIRLGITVVFLGLISWQMYSINGKEDKIAKVIEQNRLAALASRKTVVKLKPEMPQVELIDSQYYLEGVSSSKGSCLALINGIVYKKNDAIDNYIVEEITMASTTLINKLTQETKKLYFLEIEETREN